MGRYERDLVISMFQKDLRTIYSIPFENTRQMQEIGKEFVNILYLFLLPRTTGFVSTMYFCLDILTYLEFFAQNFFGSMLTTRNLLRSGRMRTRDFPCILYHGTTTKLYEKIRKEGLKPSKAGQVWTEDSAERSYLTDSLLGADFFASIAHHKLGGKAMILELFVRGLENKLAWNFEREKREPVRAYEIYKQFSTDETIPSVRIMDYYILPEHLSLYTTLLKIKDYYSNVNKPIQTR